MNDGMCLGMGLNGTYGIDSEEFWDDRQHLPTTAVYLLGIA